MINRRLFNCLRKSSASFSTTSVINANTPIFERMYEDLLPKNGIFAELDEKHDMYKVVKIERGPSALTVILSHDSIEHGVKGEHITVPKYIGRGLIRRRLAVYPTEENINKYEEMMRNSKQTISGRRMLLWLRALEVLKCPVNEDVKLEINEEIMARMLDKFHNIVCKKGTISLPNYALKSSSFNWDDTHEINVTINKQDTVLLKVQFVPWKPTQQ